MSRLGGRLRADLVAGSTTAGGDVLALANPEDEEVLITRFILNITTEASGAANADAGVAADGSTSADDLLDGVDIGAAAAIFDNIDDQGTNGEATLSWGADEYITVTPSADASGLEGYAYVEYIPVGDYS